MMQVPDQKFEYDLLLVDKLPNFTFIPKTFEIIKRLILKATFGENLKSLILKFLLLKFI